MCLCQSAAVGRRVIPSCVCGACWRVGGCADIVVNVTLRVQVDATIGDRMHVLDTDMDGVVSKQEIERAISFLKAQLCEYRL